MNIIAVDIGNTNIDIGFFLEDKEQFIESIPGKATEKLKKCIKGAWQQIPRARSSREGKRDGVIVISSVRPDWTKAIVKIARDNLDEMAYIIGKDIPLPMALLVDEPNKVGTDRIVAAAAAYNVVEGTVAVIDVGTALTIDLVDEKGIFQGGAICPSFELSAKALKENTAQLPKVKITRPENPFGKNTTEAINCGLYYSALGTIEEILRRYAEKIGKWPQTVLTGAGAEVIKDDCFFIDSYVPNLVVKGIVLTYKKFIEEKTESFS